jgi:hypothetical protein
MTGELDLKGCIDGTDVPAGFVGEYIIGTNSAGSALTSGVSLNVTQIPLTPGDWRVEGVIAFVEAANTIPTTLAVATSQASATLPTVAQVINGQAGMTQINATMTKGMTQIVQTGMARINTAVALTMYLVAQSTFSGGTMSVQGRISARRMR